MSARRRALRCFLWLAVLGMAAAIFAFSAQPADASSEASGRVTAALLRIFVRGYDGLPEADRAALLERVHSLTRKAAHFSEFALLAFWTRLLLRAYGIKRGLCWAWAGATLYAATDELHQLLVAGRAAQAGDLLIDSAGALAGALAAGGLGWLRRHYIMKKTEARAIRRAGGKQ